MATSAFGPSRSNAMLAVAITLLAAFHAAQGASFCDDYLKAFRCPGLGSVDTVNLAKYTGRWYELGSTANFRFTFEIGLTCTTANYTALGKSNGKNLVKVVNRGKRAVAPLRRAQIFAISTNARRMGTKLKSVCETAVSATSAQAQAAQALTSAAGQAAGQSLLAATSAISDAATTINDQLTIIQTENDRLSQNSLPQNPSLLASKGKILGALMKIRGAARKIALAGLTGNAAAVKINGLLRSSGDKASLEASKSVQTAASGFSTFGKLALASAAIGRMAAVAATPTIALVPSPIPGIRAAVAQGSALQSTTNAGRLAVSFYGPKVTEPNYFITELQGTEATGYSLATVTSCTRGQTTIWLLSRTSSVPQATIDAALASLESKGVKLAGSNPFLLTKRDSDYCTSYWGGLN